MTDNYSYKLQLPFYDACVYVYVHSCFCYVVGTFSLVMNTVSVWLYKGNERH